MTFAERSRARASRTALLVGAIVCGMPAVSRADEAELCATTAERAADLRDGGKLREALQSFTACARDACPRVVREDCRKGVFSIRERGPRLVPKVRDDAGRDVIDVEVSLDGAALDHDAETRGVLVDPGTHVVRVARAGVALTAQSVVVAATDGPRTIALVVPSSHGESSPPEERSHTASWIVGGSGLALLGVGGVLGAFAYADYRSLDRECRPRCDASRVDAVHARGIAADVTMGVGALAVAVAVVLRLMEAPPPPPRTGQAAVLRW